MPNTAATPNGLRLGSNRLLHQLDTQCLPCLAHKGEVFRPPLLDSWVHPIGACRVDDQCRDRHTRAQHSELPQRIQKADACRVHPAELGRLPNDHAHQVIDDRENSQFF